MDGKPVASVVTYTWNGILREYKIHIGLSIGNFPSVDVIMGPGDVDPLAEQ
jgi:hypothetical protein